MYDTVASGDVSVPDWIAETVETRNTVSLRLGVTDKVEKLSKKCKLYKNDPEAFLRGKAVYFALPIINRLYVSSLYVCGIRRDPDSRGRCA